ncbi:MAG: acyl carrier protein [Chloroflexi bacterium]|nr:MAG: acyl carrier protein [Chloroflexota bacterium]
MDIEARIQDYVAKNLLFSDNGFEYGNDDSFLEEGIVDSTGVLELVLFVEETFGITVDDADITRENFDSVNRLAAYIRRKLAG